MGKIVLSVVLGLLSPLVFIMGPEPFEAHRENSVQEVLAGGVAVALYLAVCQFMATRNSSSGLRDDWPMLAAMIAPLLAICLFMVATGSSDVAVPMLLAGSIGCLAGSVTGH